MAKQIAKLLKASIEDTSDLKKIAQRLAQKGRGGDSMLVHITPKEAGMLKEAGGAGSINPDTGLMEFYETLDVPVDYGFETRSLPAGKSYNLMEFAGAPNVKTGGYQTQAQPELSYGFNAPATYEYSDPTAQMAIDQYKGSASPYPAVSPFLTRDDRYAAQAIANTEFPRGMSAYYAMQDLIPRGGTPVVTSPNVPAELTPAAAQTTPATQEPSVLERLRKTVTSPKTLEQLGLAGLQAIPGILASRQAAAQGRQAKAELQTMAEPYKRRGETMITQAERGELTPVEQQQLQALQARAAQGAAARGGVGAEQAQAQIEAFRQQLLANKYDMGIKVANIGDQIAAGAIKTGLSADQYVNELTNTYFTNVARSFYGQPPQIAQPQTQLVRV
jgi:hypothetical protein